jgi:hypothetical protein
LFNAFFERPVVSSTRADALSPKGATKLLYELALLVNRLTFVSTQIYQ